MDPDGLICYRENEMAQGIALNNISLIYLHFKKTVFVVTMLNITTCET